MRIKLRPFEPEDAYSVYLWMSDPETVKYMGMNLEGADIMELALERVERITEGDFQGSYLVIADAQSGEFLGECCIGPAIPGSNAAEITIMLIPKARGKGLGKEAMAQICETAFRTLNADRLFLKCMSPNIPALRLYESAGFKTEGVLRRHACADGRVCDVIIMGLLKAEWQNTGL